MSTRKTPFVVGEWYHCYSRGIDKRAVFLDTHDYTRFLEAMYLTNRPEKIHLCTFKGTEHQKVWEIPYDTQLVAIGAHCLMPNHFHILIKEIIEGGISAFMQKLGTAYTMYFNKKYDRSGGLFTRPFRSKHITDDRYLRWVFRYIHGNPDGLLSITEIDDVQYEMNGELPSLGENFLETYPFSSLPDYLGKQRPEFAILDKDAFDFLKALP